MKSRTALCLLAAALLSSTSTPAWGGPFLNVGHRGYPGLFPENTLVSQAAAFAAGADMVEIDLQKSSDGAVVILHDDTLDRTTDGAGPVADHTLAELQQLDAGSWFAPEFAGVGIPTLEEALSAGIGQGPLLLDQKSGLTFGAEIASALTSTGFAATQLWVTAWESAQVLDIQAQVPNATILWTALSPDHPTPEDWSGFLDDMTLLGVDGFSLVDLFFLTSPFGPSFIVEAQARGFLVFAWNLFPAGVTEMQTLIAAGLDGYIVDNPAALAAELPEAPPAPWLAALLLGLVCSSRRRQRFRRRCAGSAPRPSRPRSRRPIQHPCSACDSRPFSPQPASRSSWRPPRRQRSIAGRTATGTSTSPWTSTPCRRRTAPRPSGGPCSRRRGPSPRRAR